MLLPEPLKQTLRRLIDQGKQDGPSDPQSKGLECQVVFKSGGKSNGVLSETSEGTFRFLVPGRTRNPDGTEVDVLAELFFDSSALESVIVLHVLSGSTIIELARA